MFLPDTEVELTLVGTEPLADTRLKIQPGHASRAETRSTRKTFATDWTLREATTLEILLTSRKDRPDLASPRSSRSDS